MDELAREYHDTHDPEIPEEIFELARRLGEMEHCRDDSQISIHRWSLRRGIQEFLIRRPFLKNLLHKLFSGNEPLLNQEFRQRVSAQG
jgi:hypothetical protein